MTSSGLPHRQTVALNVFFGLIAVAAGYCMIGLQVLNGTIPELQRLVSGPSPILPGATPRQPLVTRFTGVAAIDQAIVNLVSFYWFGVDGGYPTSSLFSAWMVFQLLLPMSVILMLEGWRTGHRGTAIAFSATWQLLWQFIPWAVIMSLYCITYMVFSPFAQSHLAIEQLAKLVEIPVNQLRALPFSILLGLVIPTFVVMLPSPSFMSYQLHQQVLGAWQFYPIFVYLLQVILSRLFSTTRHSATSSLTGGGFSLQPLQRAYIFTLIVATTSHIAVLTLSLSSVFFPTLFAPGVLQAFHPFRVFLPASPFSLPDSISLADGCLHLLQWDSFYVSALSLVLTVTVLSRLQGSVASFQTPVTCIVLSVLVGPGSAALIALWRRDSLVSALSMTKAQKIL